MLTQIPITKVLFKEELSIFDNIPRLGAYTVNDALRGVRNWYPEWDKEMLKLYKNGYEFAVIINGEYTLVDLDDLNILLPFEENTIEIVPILIGEGNIGSILLGVGLFAGLGFLGVSWVSLGLLGASLVFSQIFKHPTPKPQRHTFLFSGAVNTTGSGDPLPLVFGQAVIGSKVASAYITPQEQLYGGDSVGITYNVVSDNNQPGIQYHSSASSPVTFYASQQYFEYPISLDSDQPL